MEVDSGPGKGRLRFVSTELRSYNAFHPFIRRRNPFASSRRIYNRRIFTGIPNTDTAGVTGTRDMSESHRQSQLYKVLTQAVWLCAVNDSNDCDDRILHIPGYQLISHTIILPKKSSPFCQKIYHL